MYQKCLSPEVLDDLGLNSLEAVLSARATFFLDRELQLDLVATRRFFKPGVLNGKD